MIHKYNPGDSAFAWTTATEHTVTLNGARVTIVRTLGDDERDAEIGPMYEVMVRMHVFEDELRDTEDLAG